MLILAHKNPAQVVRLINELNEPERASVYVHVDKNAEPNVYRQIADAVKAFPNVKMLKRYHSSWGSFGIVQATVEGIRQAVGNNDRFDYLINLSGQDYPIKSGEQIRAKLGEKTDFSYIWHFALPFKGVHPVKGTVLQKLNRIEYWHFRRHRFHVQLPLNAAQFDRFFSFNRSILWLSLNLIVPKKRGFIKGMIPYGGGQWWCLCRKHAEYIVEYIANEPKFYRYFRFANISDEIFFQTLLLNSPYKNQIINDDLRLLQMMPHEPHAKIFDSNDFPLIAESPALFARKFDAAQDERILNLIDDKLLSGARRQTASSAKSALE